MTGESRSIGLIGKVGRNFVCLIIVMGLIIAGVAYERLGRILREQNNQRASVLTTNLSDAATGYVVGRDILQLKTLIKKYARLSGVAYAVIKDRDGKVIAHSLATFPVELDEVLTSNQRREVAQRTVALQGKTVYETRGPILEGQLGSVHLGIWADAIEEEVYRALFMLMGPIALVLLASGILAVFWVLRLVRPFRRLADVAGRISTGDLDTPVRIESQNEFGEITRSLERMRASLKAAMLRLGQNSLAVGSSLRPEGGKDELGTR